MLNTSGAESKTAKCGGAWMSRVVALCRLLGIRPRKLRLTPEEAAQSSTNWMNRRRGEKRSAAAAMAVMTRGDGGLDEAGAFAAAAAFQRLGGDAGTIETRHLGVKVAQ